MGDRRRFSARREELTGGRGLRFALDVGSHPASFADVIAGWRDDRDFRSFFNSLLADAPYAAVRWETPGVTAATLSRPFEFVVLDSPELMRRADPAAFARHFGHARPEAVTFPNLGGDALMVVPCPADPPADCAHLADFARLAPESQRQALWRAVGEAMAHRVDARPVWLNTAGTGVPWLHVRLDDRPKYYEFAPYRQALR
jgi:hypothetical protein